MSLLRTANVVLAALSTTAGTAHVLELPNKFQLDGREWLMVQQKLYTGWGAVFGTLWLATVLSTIALAVIRRARPASFWPTVTVVGVYAVMFAVFFLMNAPVNARFLSWTPEVIGQVDWQSDRWSWEVGHAINAALAIFALLLLIWAWRREEA
jgi:hypothetical protein